MHINPALKVKCNKCEYEAEDNDVLNVHKMTMHEETEDLQVKEMMKGYFHAIYDALVETNERIQLVSEETNSGFAKLFDIQSKMQGDMGNVKAEVN